MAPRLKASGSWTKILNSLLAKHRPLQKHGFLCVDLQINHCNLYRVTISSDYVVMYAHYGSFADISEQINRQHFR